MDRRSITSAQNGKKGGRKKKQSTIKAEKARDILSQMVFKEIKPIGLKLIEKAKTGDIPAIKELFDRAFGKAPQSIETPDIKEALQIIFDNEFTQKTKDSSQE